MRLLKYSLQVSTIALACFLFSWRKTTQLKSPAELNKAVLSEPRQEATSKSNFSEFRGGREYQIQPRFSYVINGLVVATHDSFSWDDITHLNAADYLNTLDLCVVWGENAANGVLEHVDITHGDWTCYVQYRDRTAAKDFRSNQLSNNHILPATDELAKQLGKLHAGDQIEISGELVDYTNQNFTRHTSITRDDVGNGACEIIYARDLKVLSVANAGWWKLREISFVLLLLGLAGASFAVFAVPFLFPEGENSA